MLVVSPLTFALSVPLQTYELGTFDEMVKSTPTPEQIVFVPTLVIETGGITVTEIVCGVPTHVPADDVGVTV